MNFKKYLNTRFNCIYDTILLPKILSPTLYMSSLIEPFRLVYSNVYYKYNTIMMVTQIWILSEYSNFVILVWVLQKQNFN